MIIDYLFFNPTGNMTALVTSAVPFALRKKTADAIMKARPICEQVGFVSFNGGDVSLTMTGGEFCGNASMCAAISALLSSEGNDRSGDNNAGVAGEFSVDICGKKYSAAVQSLGRGMFRCTLSSDGIPAGIKHAVVEIGSDSYFAAGTVSCSDHWRKTAEKEIRYDFAKYLPRDDRSFYDPETDARGLMFLDGCDLTPLVYVPAADTLFWERSCASGSMACGKYLFEKNGEPVSADLKMPGGIIKVGCDGKSIVLTENIELVCCDTLDLPEQANSLDHG